MARTVGLVACAKTKADGPRPAAELYASPLFRKAAAYCRRSYNDWFILSALHGLVEPSTILAPYDLTLTAMTRAEREAWADRVVAELDRRGLRHAQFFLHAGRAYAGVLTDKLDCELPLAGLGVGRQLAWYGRRAMTRNLLRVPALEIRQGGRPLYAFAVDGRLLHRFAAVSRVGRTKEGVLRGYQRPEVLSHITQIRAYLESEGAILPNALVLAFDRDIPFKAAGRGSEFARIGELTIPLAEDDCDKVAWVVDGQQRAAALRELARDGFPVWVTAFVARDTDEQREQFLLVNSTRPLPRDLVYELLPETDALLPDRLARQRFPAHLLDRLKLKGATPWFSPRGRSIRSRSSAPACGRTAARTSPSRRSR
jgi:DGQHR domain-containing protein